MEVVFDSLFNKNEKVNAVVEAAFTESDIERPVNTRAVLVIHHGNLIAENMLLTSIKIQN